MSASIELTIRRLYSRTDRRTKNWLSRSRGKDGQRRMKLEIEREHSLEAACRFSLKSNVRLFVGANAVEQVSSSDSLEERHTRTHREAVFFGRFPVGKPRHT